MTKTNAKKGMIPYKKGYNKDDIDYDFILNVAYDESQSVRTKVEGVRSEIANEKAERVSLGDKVANLELENNQLKKTVGMLESKIQELETKYHEALRGLISR